MKQYRAMTQKELTAKLQELGYEDITERRITDWRQKGLLPRFDSNGSGFGKGKGRAASSWTEGLLVVEQAEWVYKLLRIHKNSNEVFLPLWILGYKIPINVVREALLFPLDMLAESFEDEAVHKLERVERYERKDGILEDYIGDVVFEWLKRGTFPQLVGIPQEVMEAPMNIFFNPHYDIHDDGFEQGRAKLSEWNDYVEKQLLPLLTQGLEDRSESGAQPVDPRGIEIVFENPAFFQEYLSVPALRKLVAEATEQDFLDVQTDLQIVRTVAGSIGQAISVLMKDLPADSQPSLDDFLPSLFQFGVLLSLADISMRRNGYGLYLDCVRGEIVKKIREDFNEISEKALIEAAPAFADAFSTGFQTLKRNIDSLFENNQRIPKPC